MNVIWMICAGMELKKNAFYNVEYYLAETFNAVASEKKNERRILIFN